MGLGVRESHPESTRIQRSGAWGPASPQGLTRGYPPLHISCTGMGHAPSFPCGLQLLSSYNYQLRTLGQRPWPASLKMLIYHMALYRRKVAGSCSGGKGIRQNMKHPTVCFLRYGEFHVATFPEKHLFSHHFKSTPQQNAVCTLGARQ